MPRIRKSGTGITTVFYDIVEDLNGRSSRELILIGHLYLEYAVNKVLSAYFCADHNRKRGQWSEEIEKRINSFNKIEILKKTGLVDSETAKELHAIRETRNQIGHNLVAINSKYKEKSLEAVEVLEEYKWDVIRLWEKLHHVVLKKILTDKKYIAKRALK